MALFRNVLVGVDLAHAEKLDASALGPVAEQVLRRAFWLAGKTGARLTLFTALNAGEQAWHLLEEVDRAHIATKVEEDARRVLTDLVRRAEGLGIAARSVLVPGKGSTEIVRQVQRFGHDLVIAGTRNPGGLRRVLVGSTSRQLLHQCPCPVWVVKPGTPETPVNVLIASDLSGVAEKALCLGVEVGQLTGGQTHVLHVVEYPLDRLWTTGLPEVRADAYHRRIRDDAERTLRAQLAHSACYQPDRGVQIHLAEGAGIPDPSILRFIHDHQIGLLVMGTVGRGGLSRVLIGNTAERLLPEVPCSLLAVKPDDFHSPIGSE